jgi:hypothetical protein
MKLEEMTRSVIASLLVASLAGAPTSIGLISASGPLTVDRAPAWGNATLFEGTSVATAEASGDLALRNGVRIQLAAQSQAVIGETREVLEKGASQVSVRQGYEVQARGLRIAAQAGGRMLVALSSSNGVQVTALAGKASVSDRAGLLLAAIQPGRSVAFAMPQDQPGPTTVTRAGCLLYKDMHFILHDDATNEVIELNGPDLALNVGKSVKITGVPTTAKPAVSIATSVMTVTSVSPQSAGGCLVTAQALNAQVVAPVAAGAAVPVAAAGASGAATGAAVGLSAGAKAGIIIGIAAAGGIGAYFATRSSTKTSTSQ